MNIEVREGLAPKGRVTIRGYRAGAIDKVRPLAAEFMRWQRKLPFVSGQSLKQAQASLVTLKRRIDLIFDEYSLGIESTNHNLIMTGSLTGRDLLVQYLIGGTIYTGGLNYVALGTGNTAPAASDTQLTAEVARVPPALITPVNHNQIELQCFFPDANLANGTYHETGSFINASATANSGQIFNHALLGAAYTKSNGVDTTLQFDIMLI
ncbi:MAG TPA: hypothetical protein VHY35_06380 [Stellaceae bacterium]|jgi:hypothetical protein|nr:hypothetical protein [Stellaceae bacterium]